MLTVAICTWNRSALLSQTLESLTRMNPPAAPWELIVVNNGCTDATERVLDEFAGRLPLRRALEAEAGLSHARNAAIRRAAGDYIVWTDDDAIVDQDWLRAYERALALWPEAAVFGGPVRPKFEGAPPPWLIAVSERTLGVYAARALGREPFALELNDATKLPYGPNYLVRMREQRRFLYDPNLGRKRAAGALGEETAVIRAILAAGGAGRWVPDAIVDHWIPKERQTIKYLRNYYMLLGRTYYREAPDAATRWNHRRRLRLKIFLAEARYVVARLSGNPDRRMRALIRASKLRGAVEE